MLSEAKSASGGKTAQEFKSRFNNTWCPGCGNYGILNAVKAAFAAADLNRENTVAVSGIGCSGKMPQYLSTYGFEGIHGRVLPVATAIKLCNHKLKVVGFAGDGDAYGIGMCHFMHALRRNIDITYVVHDNQIYGLTTGQTSPTSDKGFVTKSTPYGVIEEPVNPVALAIGGGATFVARCFVGEFAHFKNVLTEALKHKGFALVDVFQPCVTWNFRNTYEWFQQRVYKLEEIPGYDPLNKETAYKKAVEGGEKLPIGIFYKEEKNTYGDDVSAIKEKPLAEQDILNVDISPAIKETF